MNIKTVHDLINFYAGKFNTGYFTHDEINDALNSESFNLFLKYYQGWEATQEMSDFLRPFLKEESLVAAGGLGTLPADMEHPVLIQTELVTETDEDTQEVTTIVEADKNIEVVDRAAWAFKITEPTFGPTVDYPVIRLDTTSFQVRPVEVTKVFMQYLKTPVESVYTETPEGEFDQENSVDLEWSETLYDQLINRTLANLGISMREGELIEYSQIEKQQERQ